MTKIITMTILSVLLTGCSTPNRDASMEQYPTCISPSLGLHDSLTDTEDRCIKRKKFYEAIEETKRVNKLKAQEIAAKQERIEIEERQKRETYLQSDEGKKETETTNAICDSVAKRYMSNRNRTLEIVEQMSAKVEYDEGLYICHIRFRFQTAVQWSYVTTSFLYSSNSDVYDILREDFL